MEYSSFESYRHVSSRHMQGYKMANFRSQFYSRMGYEELLQFTEWLLRQEKRQVSTTKNGYNTMMVKCPTYVGWGTGGADTNFVRLVLTGQSQLVTVYPCVPHDGHQF